MNEEIALGLWAPVESQADIDFLMEAFDYFHDSVLVDLKYFSANKVEFEQPEDTSEWSHVYVKFQSMSPNIAENPDRNEVVLKFSGVDQININSSVYDQGDTQGVTLEFNDDGAIVLAVETENSIETDDEGRTTPTFVIAKQLGWSYDLGDDER